MKPTNRFGSPEEAVKHFLDSRAETEEFLNNTPGLREHVSDSPLGMKLDCYEWMLFVTAHSERHLKQILEVKADPNFPEGVSIASMSDWIEEHAGDLRRWAI